MQNYKLVYLRRTPKYVAPNLVQHSLITTIEAHTPSRKLVHLLLAKRTTATMNANPRMQPRIMNKPENGPGPNLMSSAAFCGAANDEVQLE